MAKVSLMRTRDTRAAEWLDKWGYKLQYAPERPCQRMCDKAMEEVERLTREAHLD